MSVYVEDRELANQLKPQLLHLRVIVAAMVAAALAYLWLAITVRVANPAAPVTAEANLLRWIVIFLTPLAFWAGRIVSSATIGQTRRQIVAGSTGGLQHAGAANPLGALSSLGEDGVLFGAYQTQAIISAALLEFTAFACITSFMWTGSLASFALTLALVCGLVAMFPFPGRVVEWIEGQRQLVEHDRLYRR